MPFRDLTRSISEGAHYISTFRSRQNTAYSVTYGPPPHSLERVCRRPRSSHYAGLPGSERGQARLPGRHSGSTAGYAQCRASERKLRKSAVRDEPNSIRHAEQYWQFQSHHHAGNGHGCGLQHLGTEHSFDVESGSGRVLQRDFCATVFGEFQRECRAYVERFESEPECDAERICSHAKSRHVEC